MTIGTSGTEHVEKQGGFNRFMVRWLASPFGALSGRVMLVRYLGRVSGLRRQLPVNCEPVAGGYLIRVGRPDEKTWWRNFRSPWPIELVHGRTLAGTAVVVTGQSSEGLRLASDYFARHHGAARRAGLPRPRKGESPSSDLIQAAASKMVFVVVTDCR